MVLTNQGNEKQAIYVVKRVVVIQSVKIFHCQRITWHSVLDYFFC